MKKKRDRKQRRNVAAVTPKVVTTEVRAFGIRFRKQSHLNYFVVSMIIFIGCVVLGASKGSKIPFAFGYLLFINTSWMAIIATRMGKRDTRLFSPDCIWWNLILSLAIAVAQRIIFHK